VNSSYSPAIAEYVRCMPFDEAPDKFRASLEQAVKSVDQKLSLTGGKHSSLLMDHATRAAVMALHEEGNANIARRYFGRDALFLEPMPGPDDALAKMVLPSDSAALMRDFVAPMIQSLIKQYVDSSAKN
jgi:hypothetical protein